MERKCMRRGKFPDNNKNDCLAINVRCRQCSKIRRYASVCRNKSEIRELKDSNFLQVYGRQIKDCMGDK